MSHRIPRSKQVDNYIRKLDPKQKKIVQNLRELILETLPEVQEEYKWNTPYYQPVCYIASHGDHVNLGFCFGGLLPKSKTMKGEGKLMRHIKIKKLSDIKKRDFAKLMRESLLLFDQTRDDKVKKKKI
ncbi:MAG TPA: DUF1801 domain-containing protein [Patescibacteria group bacterium]|nr:DUF1801 domain-containing protein [Patescibacteria group bacterium]